MENSGTLPAGVLGRRTVQLAAKLHEAVQAGDHDLAKRLLADRAPVDATDDRSGTPLHRAVKKGDVEMVQLLLAEGADKEALDGEGQTPLISAAWEGHHAVVEALLAAGADASRRWCEFTALHVAAMIGHVHVLDVLIRHGVDVNDAGGRGTALHKAAANNKPDAIDLLVAAGANTEARNQREGTPLHCAALNFGLEAAVALLKHGADINAQIRWEQTPLHAAAGRAWYRGAVEMVDLLLRWGADETATDLRGQTPAEVAGHYRFEIGDEGGVERVLQLLASAPADRAWRRRGLLVASRARPQMVSMSASTQAPGAWMGLMGRVLGLVEEGVFRTIVGYL